MSRLFFPNRFCAKFSQFAAYDPPWFALRLRQHQINKQRVILQQQRPYIRSWSAASSKYKTKSRIWAYGVGVGVALAVGLKYYEDTVKSSCDVSVKSAHTGRYRAAIEVSRDLLERIKDEVGAPGMVVGVSVDGQQVWCEGTGYADLENRVPCSPQTIMRIASISKPLTTAAAARLCEEGKLDLDVPVQKYVPKFPQKQIEGQDVIITPRMIMSHVSGIRHYEKNAKKLADDREKVKPIKEKENEKTSENKDKSTAEQNNKSKEATQVQRKTDVEQDEFYLNQKFENVSQGVDLFKDDPLVFKPGTGFLYSTHAYTLLSACMEQVAGQRFLDYMMGMFRELGMLNTVADENEPIIYHRARFYHIKWGRIVNSPYVDNSYKWAGGGFLSTAGDLLLFGDALLYSYQLAHLKDTEGLLPGFLKPQSVLDLWAPVDKTEATWDKDGRYAQGWLVVEKLQKYGHCRKRRHYVSHTGGAVGASSVLLVLPAEDIEKGQGKNRHPPQGVVVTIMTNMQAVGLNTTALKIAHEFDKARSL
ncbi:serine beta-lactamase-like protein LACTB, mitochondrial isoform X2 [Sphaeramia orbicularis]|uniref:Beta-lactamase-related domain-containing protein n=1 Tax=Sphaeramia orbicularis TaxID=375764 RepID=A0A673CUD9_9TELE|nr:serine beta-lactamase-like protein LACTB, mitochondrial isoform X2 [Sphaeramia orbicularis]